MQKKNLDSLSQAFIDKIISVAYKDAGFINTISVYMKSIFNKDVRKILEEYKLTSKTVKRTIINDFPAASVEIVRRKINLAETDYKAGTNFYPAVISFTSTRRYSIAVTGILVLAISVYIIMNNQPKTSNYTNAEIEIAQKQFKETMAIVNKVFKNTKKHLDENVLKNHVSKPLNKGFNFVNELITGG